MWGVGGAGGQQFWSGAEETDEAEMDWPLAAVSCIFGQDSVIEDTTGPSQTVTCEMVSEARLQERVHGFWPFAHPKPQRKECVRLRP